MWCWRRPFRVPWTASRSNQTILKEISLAYSLEGLMLKLKFNTLATSCDRGWDGWMASLTRWTWVWVNSVSWWWTGRPGVLRFMGSQRVEHDWATELMLSTLSFPSPFIWFVLSVTSFRKPKSFYICRTALITAWHLSVYFPLSCQRTLLEMVSIHLGHMPHS